MHIAKYIVFEMLHHNALTLKINMNTELLEQSLKNEKGMWFDKIDQMWVKTIKLWETNCENLYDLVLDSLFNKRYMEKLGWINTKLLCLNRDY